VIVDSAQKMTRIIRQLLEFARRRGPRKERRDVTAVAEHTIELLRPLAERQRVLIVLEEDAGPHEASIDAAQIEQALTNLVVNAIQAMPDGGKATIQVGRARAQPPPDHGGTEGDWIVVRVVDQGSGISEADLTRVFEPFFTTKDVGRGTGLGLSVSYGIARDHGGWIDVDSPPGQGARFALFLPPEAS
jgi:two-component system NtrC family sensor kinase